VQRVVLIECGLLTLDHFTIKANPMTPLQKRRTTITKRMAEDMLLRNMSVRTTDYYTYHVYRFAKHFGVDSGLGLSHFSDLATPLIARRKVSSSNSILNTRQHGDTTLVYAVSISCPLI